LASAELSTTHE
jgi:serine/threonine protein kinase